MSPRNVTAAGGRPAARTPRAGLFGLLGSGNSGNDASMETVLAYLRDAHPDVVVDAMCGGDEAVLAGYGIDAVPLYWYHRYEQQTSGAAVPVKALLKVLGKGIDTVRIASWARRHDAVIVAGAGALETTLPQRPWQYPFALFTLTLSGRLLGTKVALVSVGADTINKRVTRWLSNSTARLAFYRSYRDAFSRDAVRQRGIDTSGDRVYPDLVFGVPTPPYEAGDPQLVGVGVMAYYGGNDDRKQAAQIHSSYVEKMTRFCRWLIDSGHRVRLFGGDSKFDGEVADQILADLRRYRPDLDSSWASSASLASYAELMRELSPCGVVVATRYHNVMCALKLCKPTISLGYSRKFVSLMADMGLAEFNQFASSFDVDQLIEQFKELESRRTELQRTMAERNKANRESLHQQFAVLSGLLFPPRRQERAQADDRLAGKGTG
jgi:polysaccharide pyruvyl transferase WcaK-like protein